jgi:hypothetical protein
MTAEKGKQAKWKQKIVHEMTEYWINGSIWSGK